MQKGLLVCLLVGLTTSSTTARPQEQATWEVISSVPAPAEMFGRFGWQPSMVGCGTDETITTYLQLRHEIVKFGLNGAVSVRIDTAHLLEPGETWVESLAPGPNGELYVMAAKAKRLKKGGVFVDGHPTLFRFDANGGLIISRRMPRFLAPRIAVFDSGDFLLFDAGPLDKAPEATMFSADGAEVKRIDLSGTALDRRNEKKAEQSPDEALVASLAMSGNKVFISTGIADNAPTVTIVGDDGKVIASSSLKLPTNFSLSLTRMVEGRLFAELECKANALACRSGNYYAEFDTTCGDLLAIEHDTGSVKRIPACNTSSGMSFLNGAEKTLEVINPTGPKQPIKE
jgi:hypothetical protein